ncbi:hypothetical protein [Lelliottia sp. CFBP8978]|jgi:membrane protein YdbS with pleckstrin-like domain|uniref:hypothetical protein n=1 Tax=Lelliottia sp. CFBP8978 TaxID=3096522 RepID=UPI002A6AE398|nr:hypothetical protein [Lelliottia sp. CFBP8978]MDY1036880.1 hypothetical protein [Lelliottia sp. CFBP8978]
MNVTDDASLLSGFTQSDLQKIKNNVESYGGTLEEAIQDLANCFRILLWVFLGCIAMFIWMLFSNERDYVISTGTGLSIAMLIAVFVQPPVLSWKSWRFLRMHKF